MRIALLSNLYPPDVIGGYELLAADVARELALRGHDVAVLTSGMDHGPERFSSPSSGAERLRIWRTLRLARPFGKEPRRDRLRHLVAARHNHRATERFLAEYGRPDRVLVMSLRRVGLESLRVFARRGIGAVVTVNDDWPAAYVPLSNLRRVGAWLDRLPLTTHTWRGLDISSVVWVSDAIHRRMRALGAPLPEGRQCFHGIDARRFAARPFRPMGRPLSLLLPGRLHPSKAPDVAIDALAALVRSGHDARLELVGDPVTPAYGSELCARVLAAGLADRVSFRGQVGRDEMSAHYHAADLVLFLNRGEIEGQGMTYLEALASGVPVVACPDGGARELLDRAPVAVRPPRCDGPSVAAAIAALSADVAEQRRLSEAGPAFVRKHADLRGYVDVLLEELSLTNAATRG